MIGRRGVLSAASALVLARRASAADGTWLDVRDGGPAGHLAALEAEILMRGGPALGRQAGRVTHGMLAQGLRAFPAAAYFAGMPLGLDGYALREWVRSADGARLWHEGWAAAGFRAFPCGIIETRHAVLAEAPLRQGEDLARVRIGAQAGIAVEAWGRLAREWGVGAAPLVMPAGDGRGWHAHHLPFAYGGLIEFAVPLEVWHALAPAARAALAAACEACLACATLRLEREDSHPLPPVLVSGLGDAVSHALRGGPGEVARAYAAARLRPLMAGGPLA